ncbi:MAG: hypothetical protein PHT78_09885 [Desulfitobacteriaceae bacterium]|nr:hypothetical protein [Desulfitobacteriaceae bacterium]
MTKEPTAELRKERNDLLMQYIKAGAKEKIAILVKIMDIDEKIEDSSGTYRNGNGNQDKKIAR